MKTISSLLVIIVLLFFPQHAFAQLGDSACACMQFPYYFCNTDSTQTVICAKDPYHLPPPNNASLAPYRRPDANVCFKDAYAFNTGEIADGTPSIQLSNTLYETN